VAFQKKPRKYKQIALRLSGTALAAHRRWRKKGRWAMARLWTEEMERRLQNYRRSTKAWELLHEEKGFEDVGIQADPNISDLDGSETHMHFLEERPRRRMKQR
jgi:hypothetical protein